MKTRAWVGVVGILLGVVVAAGAQQNCPMKVSGAEVAVADTTNGIAVTFSAKTADVKELQQRVERMANMHGSTTTMPRMQGGAIGGDVKYEALPNGARLTLTPKDPAKLAEFRAQVRAHVEQMKKGNCSMMEQMMQGMRGAAPSKPAEEDHTEHHPTR